MPRNRDRPVVDPLRSPQEAFLQPEARPVDRFFLANPPRFQAPIEDFASLSDKLARIVGTIATAGSEEEQAAGALRAQERLAELTTETGTTKAALAKLVASGQLEEQHNPYFVTGYRRAVARMLASVDYGTALEAIENGAAKFIQDSTSGGPSAPLLTPEQLIIQQRQKTIDNLRATNPDLAQDPWFIREYSEVSLRHQEELLRRAAIANGEAQSIAARNVLTAEFGRMLEQYLELDFSDKISGSEAINAWANENLRLAGVKNPHDFIFNGITAYYRRLQAEGGGSLQADRNALAALEELGKIKIAGTAIRDGQFSAEYHALLGDAMTRANGDPLRERREREAAFDNFLAEYKNRDDGILRQLGEATTLSQVTSLSREFLTKLNQNPESLGIPEEYKDEMLDIVRDRVAGTKRHLEGDSKDSLSLAVNALRNGVEPAIVQDAFSGLLSPQEHLALDYEIEKERNFRTGVEASPDVREHFSSIDDLSKDIDVSTAKSQSDGEGIIRDANRQLKLELRDKIAGLARDEINAIVRDWLPGRSEQIRAEAATKIRESRSAFDSAKEKATEFINQNQSPEQFVGQASITQEQKDLIKEQWFNTDQGKATRRLNYEPGSFPTMKQLDDAWSVLLKSGPTTTLEDDKDRRDALVTAGMLFSQDSSSQMAGGLFSATTYAPTPLASEFIGKLENNAADIMKQWIVSPNGVAATQSGNFIGAFTEAFKEVLDVATAAMESKAVLSGEYKRGRVPKRIFQMPAQFYDASAAQEEIQRPELEPTSEEKAQEAAEQEKARELGRARQNNETAISIARTLDGEQKEFISKLRPWGNVDNITFFGPSARPGAIRKRNETIFRDNTLHLLEKLNGGEKAFPGVLGQLFGTEGARALTLPRETTTPNGRALSRSLVFDEMYGELDTAVGTKPHPYALSWHVLGLAQRNSPETPMWRERAEYYTNEALKELANSSPRNEEAFIAARTLLGFDWRDLVDGRLVSRSDASDHGIVATIHLTKGHLIRWPITPLFSNLAALETQSANEEDMRKLFDVLKIVYDADKPLFEQPAYQAFIGLQRLAIRRLATDAP